MPQFDEFLQSLKGDVKNLIAGEWSDFTDEALADCEAFLEKAKSDLQRWTSLLSSGDLTQQDFEFLVQAKKELAEMEALKRAGLAKVRVDKLRRGLSDAIIGAAFRAFL